MTFTLAMVENPHVWKRAQTEIDTAVGISRLPHFDDRPSLPYVDAIVREVLRWRPAFPVGVCWKASILSGASLNVLEEDRARLPRAISIGVTTFPKVRPVCVAI